MNKVIKDKKVDILPINPEPNTIYYLKVPGNKYKQYVTDLNGNYLSLDIPPATSVNSLTFTCVLGETIGGGFLIHLSGGLAFKYDQNNLALYDSIVGITNQAGLIGQTVEIVIGGVCSQMGGLTPGLQYYASNAGLIVSTPPILNIVQPVGVALSPTALSINFEKPYIKI